MPASAAEYSVSVWAVLSAARGTARTLVSRLPGSLVRVCGTELSRPSSLERAHVRADVLAAMRDGTLRHTEDQDMPLRASAALLLRSTGRSSPTPAAEQRPNARAASAARALNGLMGVCIAAVSRCFTVLSVRVAHDRSRCRGGSPGRECR